MEGIHCVKQLLLGYLNHLIVRGPGGKSWKHTTATAIHNAVRIALSVQQHQFKVSKLYCKFSQGTANSDAFPYVI